MSHVTLVAVGASAGGVEALRTLVAALPRNLDAAVLVVLHIPRTGPTVLPRILSRSGPLTATHAVDGEALRPGQIYVAPADRHLLVVDERVRLSRGPTENGHRPAIDPLFRSAAHAAGPRTVAVVLSGSRDDGTAGAAVVSEHGGRVLVQDPDDALHPSMPRSVIEHVAVDRVCAVSQLGAAIVESVRMPPGASAGKRPQPSNTDPAMLEVAIAQLSDLTTEELSRRSAGLACPSCNGSLFELPGAPVPRYRCWVGHAWSPESLFDEQAAAFEGALWMGLRSLEERSSLARRMAAAAEQRGSGVTAEHYRAVGGEAANAARLIRDLIRRLDTLVAPGAAAAPDVPSAPPLRQATS